MSVFGLQGSFFSGGHRPEISISVFTKTHSNGFKLEMTPISNRLHLSVEGFQMSSFLEGSKGSCFLGIFFQILSALFLSLLYLFFIHAVIPNWFSSDSETLIILNLVKDEWSCIANISSPSVPYAKWSYCTFTLRKIFPKNSHWCEEIKSNLLISPNGQFPKSSVEIPGISHLELWDDSREKSTAVQKNVKNPMNN